MKTNVVKGKTSHTEYVWIQDSSSTTGGGLSGLVYNSAGLTAYYVRSLGSATSITLATQTVTGAYSSGGFVEIDATNMKGLYRLDIPDAVLASGAEKAIIVLRGATNMAPVALEIDLVAYNPQSATDLGLSSLSAAKTKLDYLPAATAGASGGLFIAGTNAATSITTALTANITGNLSGSVGSVTGAVGSVTATVSADMVSVSGDATAANNLEAMLDGTGGVDINIRQLISTCADGLPNIVLAGSGSADGISFTRTGSGNPFDAEFAAQIQQEATDALNAYDPPTNTEMVARTLAAADYATAANLAVVDGIVDDILVDTGTTIPATLTGMSGATFDTATDSLEALRNRGDAAWVTADVSALATAAALQTVDNEIAVIDGIVDAIKLKTDLIPAAPAAVSDIPTAIENADAYLKRDMSLITGEAARSPLNAHRRLMNKSSLSGSTMTVYKEDDATAAWTATVTTDAAAEPIVTVDPA